MPSPPGMTTIAEVKAKDAFLIGSQLFLAATDATPNPENPAEVSLQVYCASDDPNADSTLIYTAARELQVEILDMSS